MMYWVKFAVNGFYGTLVEAENVDEAKNVAWQNFESARFGDARLVSGKQIEVQNTDGKVLWCDEEW